MESIQELIKIDKGRGVGSSQNLGIKTIGDDVASCLCGRDYKGISREGANAVMVTENKFSNGDKGSDDVARGIKAQYYKTSPANLERTGTMGASGVMQTDKQNVRIRKLTPKECWRLQGWGVPIDGLSINTQWDDSNFEKAQAAGVSSTQLYKQAGNGCSANITEVIGIVLNELEALENESNHIDGQID